jgi:hypothetical protein
MRVIFSSPPPPEHAVFYLAPLRVAGAAEDDVMNNFAGWAAAPIASHRLSRTTNSPSRAFKQRRKPKSNPFKLANCVQNL